MWENIKKGFGLAVGVCIGHGLVNAIAESYLEWRANNDEVYKKAKAENSSRYEILKKYRTKKEETVDEEES